jgi:hypothetical protein
MAGRHAHLHGLVTSIHEISRLLIASFFRVSIVQRRDTITTKISITQKRGKVMLASPQRGQRSWVKEISFN